MNLFADLVETSGLVASTRSRKEKVAHIADYLARVNDGSISPAVAFLSGTIPTDALGVGWATIGEPPPPSSRPSLTVDEVMSTFTSLLSVGGTGSNLQRRRVVADLMSAATQEEQRFLFGLLTGEVRQGAQEGVMVEAVARSLDVAPALVRRAAMLGGRLWEVAAVGRSGGEEGLSSIGLTVLRPVKPMLASSAPTVGEAMEGMDGAAVEWKLDGIRIQVHRLGGEVEVFTRNLNRVTERFGDLVAEVGRLDCRSIVLDGEALYLEQGRPARFQETAGRFGTEQMPDRGMHAFYFDILHLDGVDLIDRPLRERRRLLEGVVGEAVIPHVTTASVADAEGVVEASLSSGHEGVVVKSLDSAYVAGRRGSAWVKVKPVHTLDLVVLGAEWGHGRREGWLSNLHLGARSDDDFVMVGKTFKGMTDALLEWQTARIQEIEERRTQAAVFARPELVVEIGLDGVQVSTRYPGGVALRFARVRRYRDDKDPAEADTIDTVRAMAGLPPLDT